MLPQFLALTASLCFAFLIVFIQLGLNAGGTPIGSTLINTAVNALLLWIVLAFSGDLGAVLNPGIWLFLLIGMFVPGLARYAYFYGANNIGASRAATLKSLSPMFSVLVAIAGFGEHVTLPIGLGTGLIVLGIVLVSGKADERESWSKLYLVFPVLTALLFAFRDNLARFGFSLVASPLVGATMAATGGFLCLSIISCVQGNFRHVNVRHRSSLYFAVSGILGGIAYMALFTALSTGRVVTVAPLGYADPLLVPLLSYFILRGSERVTWRLALGAAGVVAGISLILGQQP